MKPAPDHPGMVDRYLAREEELGRVLVLDREALPAYQVSRFGVIPKSQPGTLLNHGSHLYLQDAALFNQVMPYALGKVRKPTLV